LAPDLLSRKWSEERGTALTKAQALGLGWESVPNPWSTIVRFGAPRGGRREHYIEHAC